MDANNSITDSRDAQNDCEKVLLDPTTKNSFLNIMQDCSAELGTDFLSACTNGAAYTFIMNLSEERLKKYGCSYKQIHLVNLAIQCLFTLYNGSYLASTAAIAVTHIFSHYLAFTPQHARLAGSMAALCVDVTESLTPWSMVKMTASSVGSYAGGWCGFWANQKLNACLNHKEPEKTLLKGAFMV